MVDDGVEDLLLGAAAEGEHRDHRLQRIGHVDEHPIAPGNAKRLQRSAQLRGGALQLEYGSAQRGFPTSRFAHQAQGFAGKNFKAHVVHGFYPFFFSLKESATGGEPNL